MRPFESSFGSIVSINAHLALAAGCGFAAWIIWPTSTEWWGFGVTAIFLAGAAMTAAGKAVRLAMELRAKKRAIAEFEAQGGSYAPVHVIGERELELMGMLDE
jgi:hypothetical protein